MTGLVVDVLGWAGAAALLTAYALVSAGRTQGGRLGFQALNLFGALGLLVNGMYHGAWPSAGLNAVWLFVGVAATARVRRDRTADAD
jgi:hypothetical protein